MKFSQKLRELMEIRGVTAYKLSKQLNLTQSMVSDWLNDKRMPNVDKMTMLAKYFACPVTFLVVDEINDSAMLSKFKTMSVMESLTDKQRKCIDLEKKTSTIDNVDDDLPLIGEIVKLISTMNKEQLEMALAYIQFLATNKKEDKEG